MSKRILILVFVIVVSGCSNKNLDNIYLTGIEHFFNNLPFEITDNIFKYEICLIPSSKMSSDIEFKSYVEHKYSNNGYLKLKIPDDKKLHDLYTRYFKGVHQCELEESNKSVRNLCRNNNLICVGVTPVYWDDENDLYFFTFSMPPNIGVDISVDRHMNSEIVNFDIK
jgi:hypothetical protein